MVQRLNEPARVHQTTSTSGTGTYSLNAAAGAFRNFRDFFSSGTVVPYVCTDNANNYEIGAGVLTLSGTDTITRGSILYSSNSNNPVNWPSSAAKDIFAWGSGAFELTPEQFGAVGDGTGDQTIALNNWFGAVVATGLPGRLIGTYRCTSQLTWDMSSVRTKCPTIHGCGNTKSIIDLTAVAASPALNITSSSDAFFGTFRDFGVNGNYAGKTVQLGKTDYSGPFNSFIFEGINVKNSSNASGATAVQMNAFLNGKVYMVTNCGGSAAGTISFDARQVQFTQIGGSLSTAETGVNMSDYCFGNSFQGVDIENATYCVQTNGGNIGTNHFNGGTMVFSTGLIKQNAAHGYRCIVFDGCNFGPSVGGAPFYAPGSIATGAHMRGIDLTTTPAIGASGVAVKNTSGNEVIVNVWSGTVTLGHVSNSDTSVSVDVFGAGGGCCILQSGDSLAVTYSSTPSWLWRPIL